MMKKKYLLLTLPFLSILILFVLSRPSEEAPKPSVSTSVENDTATSQDDTQNQDQTSNVKGSYQDYSEQALNSSSTTNLLFFHAPWCPQCRSLEKSIQESELPDGVTIFKVDYDSNQELRKKYGVTIQTTVVKLNNQRELDKKYTPYDNPSWDNVERELL